MRVFHTLLRLMVIVFFVGAIVAISQYSQAIASSPTPTPTIGLESGSSSNGSELNVTSVPADGTVTPALPVNGEWTLYPVVTLEQGVANTDYAEGNSFTGYNTSPVTLPGIKVTATGGTITLENFVPKPLIFQQLSGATYGVRYDSQTAEDRQTDEVPPNSLLLIVDQPQQLWLVYQQTGMEYAAQTLLLALPGKPRSPDPRYGTVKRCPGANDSLLKAGDKAVDVGINNNNLRANANQSAKLLGAITPDTEMDVLQGPICASNLAYWQVTVNGITGWTAESQASDHSYWLLPKHYLAYFDQYSAAAKQLLSAPITYLVSPSNGSAAPTAAQQVAASCPGSPAPRLTKGGRGVVLPGDPNLLNTQPRRPSLHPDSKRIVSIPGGGVFDVLEGPECADGITWWQVNYNGLIGWTGESDTSYWVAPTTASIAPTTFFPGDGEGDGPVD